MQYVLIRASCFISIIIMGHLLRRTGVFGPEAFGVMSKIVIKITLPAAIVSNFVGKVLDAKMLTISLVGFCICAIYMLIGYVLTMKKSREQQAFEVLNLTGYNIGNFALPFAQSFLGPMGVVANSLFDVGNSMICQGGAYGVASMIQDGNGFSLKTLWKKLSSSVPFLTYITMTILCLLKLSAPAPIVELASIIGGANTFIAMLMIGVGFHLEANRDQIGHIIIILGIRYGVAALFALFCYYVLPFELDIRQALVLLAFSPIASAAPAYTGELKNDVGLASAVNSISMLISIAAMVLLLVVMV